MTSQPPRSIRPFGLSAPRGEGGRETVWHRLLALHAACAFAVAQPLFVRLSTQSAFLLDSGTTPVRLILTVVGIFLAPALVLWGLTLLMRPLGVRFESAAFAVLVSVVLGLFCLQVAKRCLSFDWLQHQGLSGGCIVAVTATATALIYRCCRRSWFVRGAVVAAIGSLLFPLQFVRSGAAVTILDPSDPPPPTQMGNPFPVVVIVFDEFSGMTLLNEERQIDKVRYPNFARLAESATWYRNATTVHSRTNYAVPAILTGRLPLPDRETTLAESPQNLFTLLQSAGYSTAAFEPVSRLCPVPDRPLQGGVSNSAWMRTMLHCLACVYLKAVTPTDLDVALPRIPEIWYGLGDLMPPAAELPRTGLSREFVDVTRVFEHFLRCLPDGNRRQLCVLHAMTPHWPWRFLPDGTVYLSPEEVGAIFGGGGPLGEDWVDDELQVAKAWQRYLFQVGDVDRRLGIVLDHLQASGVYEDCLLVVVGDHGVSFQAGHSRRVPDGANLSDILSVPLFIKLPGQRTGHVSDRNAESIDVFPTIAAALNIELPLPVDGDSLLDESAPFRLRKTIAFEGGSTVVDAEFPDRYRAVERMLDTFGSGTWNDRLYAPLGPHSELIGQRIEQFEPLSDGQAQLRLYGSSRTRTAAAERGVCYVQGHFLTEISEPVSIAFVQDEVVVGTSRTSSDPALRGQFDCLLLNVPQPFMINKLEACIIRASHDRMLLEPVVIEPRPHGA
jgi:hypothetical protein